MKTGILRTVDDNGASEAELRMDLARDMSSACHASIQSPFICPWWSLSPAFLCPS